VDYGVNVVLWYLVMKTARENRSAKGGVLIELSFVLPALIFLIVFIIGSGQLLTQLFWYGQSAYQAVYLAGETPTGFRESNSKALMSQLEFVHLSPEQRSRAMVPGSAAKPTGSLARQGTDVVATMAGVSRPVLFRSYPLRVSVRGPVLVAGDDVADSSGFQGSRPGGARGHYSCCGERQANPSPMKCADGGLYRCLSEGMVGYYPPPGK
jgi:hypothetical protein